ncbi:MAG TPA: T9SS type A sorting domain-containing protein, partial [Flavobacterium sp.]|nr:T9SS type A sorting domain-containing protein [Flavobacterium sp.]
GIQWYTDPTNETPLALTDLLETGNYYVSQTIGNCESARTSVVITVDVVPAPEGENSQEFTEGETLGDLDVSGSNLTWYPTPGDAVSQTGALEETLILNDGAIYYVTQTINGCTSIPLSVAVSVTLGIDTFDDKTFDYYPNPVSETLYVVDASIIETISVFDMLGRELIYNTVHSEKAQIDVSSLLSGTYIVNVKTNGSNKSFKVIKK